MAIVLVTGGAGFIGSHVVERLIEQGHTVRVLDDFSTGSAENLTAVRGRVQVLEASILDASAVRSAVQGCEAVIHLAARISVPESVLHPAAFMETNVTGTAMVLSEALSAGVHRVVMASSAAVYGTEVEPPHNEGTISTFQPSPYAVSKFAMEELGKEFTKRRLTCASLRMFNVFGPRQRADSGYAAAVPSFMAACATGRNPLIYGDGSQTRDFTYVENAAEAFVRAAFLPGISGIYNIGSGKATTISQLCALIIQTSGAKAKPQFGAPRPGDLKHSFADTTKAVKILGVREAVPLSEGLKKTWEWFSRKNQG